MTCHRKTFLIVALPLLLASCTVVPPARETVVYQLREAAVAEAPVSADLNLKIMSVQSSDALNSRRIMATADGSALFALPTARWASPVRELLRERLVEGIRASGAIAGVIGDSASLKSDVVLHSSVRDFVADFSTAEPAALVRLDATLADGHRRTIIATREFRVRTPGQGRDADAVVAAFSRATDQLAEEIVTWVVAETSTSE